MLKAKSVHRCHEMGHSDSDQNKWDCQICSKTFVDKGHFLGHVNKNIGKKPFKCPKCKQQYTYKASFRRHVKIYSDPTAKNFKCQKCDQIFVKKNLLSDHIKGKHGEGLGKYRCQVCSKAFRYRPGQGNNILDWFYQSFKCLNYSHSS